ncbi:MAG: flagellar basal body rod protein FlgB [Armatimonadetes bacterium]|nr:flagellar basal body rod protein FlgB [Armatimonadota bacterium]
MTTRIVSAALDGLTARQRAYAANLANIETPGYQAQDVHFEAELRRWQAAGASAASTPDPELVVLEGGARADGNTVEIDRQMALLAENALTYQALTEAQRMRGQMLRDAILEGKR